MFGSEEGVPRIEGSFVEWVVSVVVRLVGPVLTGIEDEEFGEFSKVAFPVNLHVGSFGKGGRAQWHHFIVSLIGVGSTEEKLRRGDPALFRNVIAVIVINFVIIPGEEPRTSGVHGLEIGVSAVLAVAHPVLVESFDFRSDMSPDVASPSGGVFVNVVAEVEDEVGLVLLHFLVSTKEALLPVLARRDGEAKFLRVGIGRRHGAGASDRARGVAGLEAVVEPMICFQTSGLDMDGEPESRRGRGFARCDDFFEGCVARDFPANFDWMVGHASTGFEGFWTQPSP